VKEEVRMGRKFVIDADATDDFLDYPPLIYRKSDGTLEPLFTDEQLANENGLIEVREAEAREVEEKIRALKPQSRSRRRP
jgi:hypothetical protein